MVSESLRQDFLNHGKVAIRNVVCCKEFLGVDMANLMLVGSHNGIESFLQIGTEPGSNVARLGLGPVNNGWRRILQGPFEELDTALSCAESFLQYGDLREPMSREDAWSLWGDMWLANLAAIPLEGGAHFQSSRTGSSVSLGVVCGSKRHNLLELIDQAVGFADTAEGTVVIRAIASDPAIFAVSLSEVFRTCF